MCHLSAAIYLGCRLISLIALHLASEPDRSSWFPLTSKKLISPSRTLLSVCVHFVFLFWSELSSTGALCWVSWCHLTIWSKGDQGSSAENVRWFSQFMWYTHCSSWHWLVWWNSPLHHFRKCLCDVERWTEGNSIFGYFQLKLEVCHRLKLEQSFLCLLLLFSSAYVLLFLYYFLLLM